jgi:oligoribonuclease
LIWIDLEMTGLDPERDHIIEIATVVTDQELAVLAEGPVLALHQSEHLLQEMDEWNTQHHGRSGLLERVRRSRIGEEEAESRTIDFLRRWVPAGRSPMCGNSICQDRRFLVCWMPQLERYFHYRHLDVSTLKELAKRWYPNLRGFQKSETHLAADDVRASIAELQYYRRSLFLPVPVEESSAGDSRNA